MNNLNSMKSENTPKHSSCSKNKPLNLDSFLKKQMNSYLEHDIKFLQSIFNETHYGIENCALKFITIDLKHIFTIKLHKNKKGVLNIKGFHHDFMNDIEKSDHIIFKDKEMFKDDFYKANLCLKEQTHQIAKTFFPSHWKHEQVIKAILEAYDHSKKSGQKIMIQSNRTYPIEGVTKSGVKIQIYLTETGKIASAFPIL